MRYQRQTSTAIATCCKTWELLIVLILVLVPTEGTKVRLYPFAIPPSKHPNQARTLVHPPPELGPAFGGKTARWAGYRGGITASGLDAYNASNLGDVVWPQFPVMYSIEDTVGLIQNRSWLYLSDISNYVPGDTDECATNLNPNPKPNLNPDPNPKP